MSGSTDLLSRFREVHAGKEITSQERILEYITTCTPMSGSEIRKDLEKITNAGLKKYENKRVKRQGKDKDDIFWLMGKIHGLENIAFLTKEELDSIDGNPIRLQHLVNQAKPTGHIASSFNEWRDKLNDTLAKYKEAVNKLNLTMSDKTVSIQLNR